MKNVFCHQISTDTWSDLGADQEIARQQRGRGGLGTDLSEEEISTLVAQWIAERPAEGWEYVIAEPCQTCHRKPGKPRTNYCLPAGDHCDECWREIVDVCPA